MARQRLTRDDVTSMVGARRELGILAAWAGIAGVNFSFSRRRR